jgi:ribonuclease J
MESIFYCAEKAGRRISLVGRSMHRIYNAARQCGYLNKIIEPIDPREAKKIPRQKILYLCTGSQGEPNGAMMRIANFNHPDILIEPNDTVIFSSKIIPGNEKKLYKLHNQLVKNGIDVVSEENEFVHVSGHPNREDLKDMYNWVKPRAVIPVHGEHRHMIEHINFAKEMQVPYPVQVENGDIVQLYPGKKPYVTDKAPVGRIYVDGKISVGEDSYSLKERLNISFNGFVDMTLIINNKGSLVKNPVITFKGIPSNGEGSNFVFELEDKIRDIFKTYSLKNSKQENNLIEHLKTTCRKTVKEKTGKRPYTNVNLIRI